MEFQAAIEALECLGMISIPKNSSIVLFTDCKVLIDNIKKLPDWNSAHWLKKNNFPIPNSDLYAKIFDLLQKHDITWNWVRAHAGNVYNERCDQLCKEARENKKPTNR